MMTQALRITPVYDLLLHGSEHISVSLYHLQMATAAQLCRLHYSKGLLTNVKARLKDLADRGYAQADAIPTELFRSPYHYALGQQGVRYLDSLRLHTSEMFRASSPRYRLANFIYGRWYTPYSEDGPVALLTD